MEKMICFCDACGKEIKNQYRTIKIVPRPIETFAVSRKQLDLCEVCYGKLYDEFIKLKEKNR